MSDLKLTIAGAEQDLGRQGPRNASAEFGQDGSVFSADGSNLVPPKHKVFVAITIIVEATFNALTAEDSTKYINTVDASHNLTATNATSLEGELGQVVSGAFPAGLTIHGRWTAIDLATGTIVAYVG
jgi:hypothetical protein